LWLRAAQLAAGADRVLASLARGGSAAKSLGECVGWQCSAAAESVVGEEEETGCWLVWTR